MLNKYLTEEYPKILKILYKKNSVKTPLLGVPFIVTKNRPDLGVINGERGLIFYPENSIPVPYACFFKKVRGEAFLFVTLMITGHFLSAQPFIRVKVQSTTMLH